MSCMCVCRLYIHAMSSGFNSSTRCKKYTARVYKKVTKRGTHLSPHQIELPFKTSTKQCANNSNQNMQQRRAQCHEQNSPTPTPVHFQTMCDQQRQTQSKTAMYNCVLDTISARHYPRNFFAATITHKLCHGPTPQKISQLKWLHKSPCAKSLIEMKCYNI